MVPVIFTLFSKVDCINELFFELILCIRTKLLKSFEDFGGETT